MDVVWIGFLSAATIAVLLVMWMYLSTKQKTYSTDTISTQSSSTPTTTKPYLKYLVPGLLLLVLVIIFVPPLFDDAPEGPQKDKVVDTEPSVTNGNEDTGAIEGQDENSDQAPSSETEPTLSVSEDILDKFGSSTDLIIVVGLVIALIWALWAIFFKKKSVQNQSQNQNQNQDQVKTGSNGFAVTILIITATILVAFHFFPEEVKSLFEKDKQSEILKFFLDTWLAIKESLGEDLIKVLVWVTALLITILVWALNRSWVTGLVMGVTFLFTVFMTTFALDKDQTEIQEKSKEVKVDLRRIKPGVPKRKKGGVFDTFVVYLPTPPAKSSYDPSPRMSYRVCGKIVGPEALLNFIDFPLFHMEFEEKNLGVEQRMITTDAVKDYIGKQSTIEAMGGFQVNELEFEFETRLEEYGSPFTCRNVRYTL